MTNPNAAFGMFEVAGSIANPHGSDDGMIRAILNTNGGTVPTTAEARTPRQRVGAQRRESARERVRGSRVVGHLGPDARPREN
jgi:hypothetical protein